MDTELVLLTEKEEMWAEMLIQVLKNNDVPHVAQPVYGAGFILKTGMRRWMRVYVPAEDEAKARELLYELFPTEEA